MTHALPVHRRHAIVFRTHFWDAFVARQFNRLRALAAGADLFILVDETAGPVRDIPHDRIVRFIEADMVAMGLPARGKRNLLWFNGDYPWYWFQQHFPTYDLYVHLEYDVVLQVGLTALLTQVAERQLDFVGLTKGEPVSGWAWRSTCLDAYPADAIRYQLICFAVLSHRALRHFMARRIELASNLAPGAAWPFCEGFLATEAIRAGMHVAELSEFLGVDAYDAWPPYLENDLPALADKPIIHPLLDQRLYVASLLKYKVGLGGFLNPASLFHRKLRRLPRRQYLRALGHSFIDKARRNISAGRLLSG